jgi:hypothetical protein
MDWLPAVGWVAIISTLGTLTSLVLAWDRRETNKMLQGQDTTLWWQNATIAQQHATHAQQDATLARLGEILAQMKAGGAEGV